MTFWTFFPIILMFIFFFLKIPVAFSMLMASAAYFLFSPNSMDLSMMIQKMVAANSSFTYLAIPLFTCAGVAFNYALGKLYLSDDPEVHDADDGIQWLKRAAQNGNADAAYRLGKEYLTGKAVQKDAVKAAE